MEESSNSIKPTSSLTKVRWMSFIAAIWLQAINGTSFDFSDYSSELKKVMGINQMKLNSLAVASDTGKIMGWVSGLICMLLPAWAVTCVAVCLGMVGYGVQWLMLTRNIHTLRYWQVYLLCFLAGNSICWINTVCFRVTIDNFPARKGMACGLSTSYVGLSTVIYTGLSSIVDPAKPSLYLMLNSIVPAVVGAISAILLYFCQPEIGIEDEEDPRNMIVCTLIAIVTAIYSIIYEFLPHGERGNEIIYMVVMVLLLIVPLYVPLKIALRPETVDIKTKVISYNPIPKVSRLSRDLNSSRWTPRTSRLSSDTNPNNPTPRISRHSYDTNSNNRTPWMSRHSYDTNCNNPNPGIPRRSYDTNCSNPTPRIFHNSYDRNSNDPTSKESRLTYDMNSKKTTHHNIITDNPAANQNSTSEPHEPQEVSNQGSQHDSKSEKSMDGVPTAETGGASVKTRRFVMKSVSAISLGEEHSILQLLRSVDFWLYYFVYFCGGTLGLVYINNLGQILQSLGYSKTPIIVALVSSLGFFGRIASGLPDYIQECNKTRDLCIGAFPRPAWIGIWMVPMVVAFFVMGIVHPTAFAVYVTTAMVGASTGAIGSIAIPTSSELFGMERFPVNHNIVVTNIAFGSVLFGEIAGMVYDSKSRRSTEGHQYLCMGRECFRSTFLAWGCVCSFGIFLCIILCIRTRALYDSIHKLRRRTTAPADRSITI